MGKRRIGWPNGPDIGPCFGVGQRHPLKNTKTPALKLIFQNFGCALKFEQKIQHNVVLGVIFHKFFNLSRSCPGDVPEMSRRCPGDVPEMSRRCSGGVPEMSRRIPGRPSHVACFRFRRLVFFLFFSWFWSNCFVFVFFVVFGFCPFLALKRLVAFNSVCKNPSVLFVVQSVPSIFCFAVVLRCFSLNGRDGDLNFQGFKFSAETVSKTQVEAKTLAFSQICADKRHEFFLYTENEMPHQGPTQKQKALQTRQCRQTAFMTNLYSKATVAIKPIMTNNNPTCLTDISVLTIQQV